MPDLTPEDLVAHVTAYLGQSTNAALDQIAAALAAEKAHQARCCRVPAALDVTETAEAARAVLLEALCRRVAVNLARRALPLGMQLTDVGTARVSTRDPEVRRLEGPYRRVVFG